MQYDFSISIVNNYINKLDKISYMKVVKIRPRYVIVNMVSRKIFIRQFKDNEPTLISGITQNDHIQVMLNNDRVPFYWPDRTAKKQI